MQEKRTLYLAGKITGDPYYFTKFYNAQKKLEEGGFIVVNPALLPAEGFTWEAYMRMLRQDAIVEEAVPEMLKAGGAVMQKAQQEEIKTRFNSRRSTGALLASIKVSAVKEIDGGKRVEIYPNGKDKHGVRNAEKGFVLNYGRSNMPARPWFTAANEKAADDVVSEMRRVWEEKQNEER